MGTILIIIGILVILFANIIIFRYIIRRSVYLTRNEISILLFSFKGQKGIIDDDKFKRIHTKLKDKLHGDY